MNPEHSDLIQHLGDEDFIQVSRMLNCELAALKAVQQVETGGRGGFFAPGKPAILFEGHIFWSQLKKRGLNPADYVTGNKTIASFCELHQKESPDASCLAMQGLSCVC